MTKKKTKTRAVRRIPAALRARALAIVNSDAYDDDTRASIRFQLKTNYDRLAETVRRAEKGDTICDTRYGRHEKETPTSQGFLLPEIVARKYAARSLNPKTYPL